MSVNDYTVSWLQTINIVIFFFLALSFPSSGPVIWFFGGFFILLIQAPLFLVLLVFQVKQMWAHWQEKTLLNNKLLLMPWLFIVIVWVMLSIMEHWHLNDPFFNDSYQIEVELFPDGSCEIIFEGNTIGSRDTHRYDWFGSKAGDIWCRDEDDKSSTTVYFEGFVGRFPIYDTEGGFSKNGGAFFDDKRGNQLSPSSSSFVYWDFVGGEIQVLKIEPSDEFDKPVYLRSPKLSVVVKAIGKRRFRGF